MDETIIEYIYWNIDNTTRISNSNRHPSHNITDLSGWDVVSSKNYNNFFNDSYNDIDGFSRNYSDGITIYKPLKLEYTIKYDINGNPYNNLNIKNTNDIEKFIYIFKPNEEFVDRNFFVNEIQYNDDQDISMNYFSNMSNITLKVEDKFKTNTFDISENKSYIKQENTKNLILRPGKWYFLYDPSGNSDGRIIRNKYKPWVFISTIKIPHVDFLYDNKKINMELNNVSFDRLFLTINNFNLNEMRNHFSKYFSTLGKNDIGSKDNDYMRIFFEFLLWTPNNIGNSITDTNSWYLPNNYSGVNDIRIQETPCYVFDSSLNETLYTGYYNSEPGIRYDRASYKSKTFFANHIASIQYNGIGTYSYNSRTFEGDANSSTALSSAFTGLSKTHITNQQYSETPNAWNGDIEIISSISRDEAGDDHFLILTNSSSKPNWIWDQTANQYKIVWNYNTLTLYTPSNLFTTDDAAIYPKIYVLKITKDNNKIKVFIDDNENASLECDSPSWGDFYIWVGADADADSSLTGAEFQSISVNSEGNFTVNNVRDISDNVFKINDLSKNFINTSTNTEDVSFVNIENVVFDYDDDGLKDLVDNVTPIDNWEAVLICPANIKLQDGSRNILSSYADSSNNSGFSLGIVGNGLYNADNPNESYIFKDICGNIFPNVNNTIDFMEYGVEFDISNNESYVKEPFDVRYKIRRNTEKTDPPFHDVYIFINDQFVTKISDNGCKLNDLKYWGTPYDPNNPYKEYDICNNGFIVPKINGIPRGFTTLLQSLKLNNIEDIYRPFGKPDSSFISNILYNDEQYIEISGNVLNEYFIDLSYNLHEHKQSTTTINPSNFIDIAVNPINNYPCTLTYDIKRDNNITPLYGSIGRMINLDDLSSDETVRILKNSSNWLATDEQVKPLNYSYIFDAGEGRTLVLTINDFQFFHTASEVFDRLEIVAGDISSNTGNIEWKKIKNNEQPITWLHNLQDTTHWKDSTPLSDENLKKNTEIDNTLQSRSAIKDAYFLSHNPKRYENEYIRVDNTRYRWQPPPTNGPYVTNGNSWDGLGYRNYNSWRKKYYYYPGWTTFRIYGGYYNYYYSYYYPILYSTSTWWKTFKEPEYYPTNDIVNFIDNEPKLYGYYIKWRSSGYNINPPLQVDGNGDPLIDGGSGKQYTLEKYSLSIVYGYAIRYWAKPYYIGYYNKEAKEIKRSIELVTKTYGTHNYNPKAGELKEINSNGELVNKNQPEGDDNDTDAGIAIDLGIRDFRTNTDISMKFNRDGSPYVNGLDGTDQYGQISIIGQEDPVIQLDSLDISGSILPKNKKRAIKILDFYNSKSGTGIVSKENDTKIWRIYTNKRYVRLNYFALKSSTNCHFEIKVDRTLSATEVNTLKQKWDSEQKIIFKQKDRGIMPVKLSEAYDNDLCGNQIESIVNEVIPNDINLSIFPNSNYYVNNNNEIPYIGLCNYFIRDQTNDIILSSRIKKTNLDDTTSYKYDDNRNLRELNIYTDPRLTNPVNDISSNPINKIKQKYIYNVKLLNNKRNQILPYIPKSITTSFLRNSSILQFLFLNVEKLRLKNNLINYWLGDIHKTYIKLFLFIWKPYSEYFGTSRGISGEDLQLNNANLDNEFIKDRLNIDINSLSIQDYSYNVILYKNSELVTSENPVENHINKFDQLLEISFDTNSFFYGINSIGFPEKNFEYKITEFKGQYVFCWTYHVYQPDGIYNDLSPLDKLIINNDKASYNTDGQVFDTSQFTKDDFIYDTNDPLIVWNDTFENSFNVSLREEEKNLFKSYLSLLQKDFSSTTADIDISCVEITFYIWTPNNCKYDKILGEDLSSNNDSGWILPNDYYGIQDPRIFFTPYKSNTISWNPIFNSTTYDSSGTTHYGYNFDLSGVIKRTFIFKKKGNTFSIEDSISDISFNDLSFNITKNDISFNQNDALYNIGDKFPNTLEYLKLDNTTGVEYSVPYLSRWMHTVYDTCNNKLESRVIKLTGSFGNETSFNIKFKLSSDYYYELKTEGMEGATPFRRLLQQKKTDGITFGYKKNTNYLLIKVDDITYQIYIEEPPINYAFFQLDENGDDIVDNDGNPVKIIDNSIKNIEYFGTNINIDGNEVFLNSSSGEDKYILYIRPSTNKEKVFLNSLNKHQIVQMETEEIRNRFSNWEPMRHNNNVLERDSNNYYRSDNQYKYGVLFSTTIDKIVDIVEEKEEVIDPCDLCRPINNNSKDFISSKLKYANRERLSRTQASKYTPIC